MASSSVPMRVLLVLVAVMFLVLQVALFGRIHVSDTAIAAKAQESIDCNQKFRAVVDENQKLKEEIYDLQQQVHASGAGGSKSVPREMSVASIKPQAGEETEWEGEPQAEWDGKALAAVVVMACKRPEYLKRTLESVFGRNPDIRKFPVFVSQDGTHEGVKSVAKSFKSRLSYMQHIETEPPKPKSPKEDKVYYRIAEHYKWALGNLFDGLNYPRVIILEDDMELAVDFFQYFARMSQVMDTDPKVWCVSSWNDNGQQMFVQDPTAVYRSDFFPGLGWMLSKSLWEELEPIWTTGPPTIPGIYGGYWDDWMRNNEVRKGRQCLRPEVCRTYNFGEKGASKGQYFRQYLKQIKLNDVEVDWDSVDISVLIDEKLYHSRHQRWLRNATIIEGPAGAYRAVAQAGDAVAYYNNAKEYQSFAQAFNIMQDWKAGVPRTSYQGVVNIRINSGNARVFIAPGPGINLHPEGYIIPPEGGRP